MKRRHARKTAETYLREAEAEGRAMEASMARRALGVVSLFQGDLELARSYLERALADCDSERDAETRLVFGRDPEAGAAAFLAVAVWHSGEVERARQLINRAIRRADELGHAASIVQAHDFQTVLESHRDDVPATLASADDLLRLAQNYGISVYAQQAQMYASWAHGRLLDPDAGASGLKQALAAYTAQGNKIGTPSFHGLLAELEAMTKSTDSALTLIDNGLRIAQETGEHWTDPYLHRLRGDILLKRDSADPAPAEEAYQTAIAIAKDQGGRSYELLASLSLAKLYQSTRRLAEARAVLAPALEGFSPTPEMLEIAEAEALMERLA